MSQAGLPLASIAWVASTRPCQRKRCTLIVACRRLCCIARVLGGLCLVVLMNTCWLAQTSTGLCQAGSVPKWHRSSCTAYDVSCTVLCVLGCVLFSLCVWSVLLLLLLLCTVRSCRASTTKPIRPRPYLGGIFWTKKFACFVTCFMTRTPSWTCPMICFKIGY